MIAPPHTSDSRQPPAPSSSKAARRAELQGRRNGPPEALDAVAEVPLHQRPVVTYAEVAALGIAPERTLRRLVATGRVKRAVLRVGRSVKFVVQDLIDELRGAEE